MNCLCSHVSRGHDKILPQLPFPHQVPGLDIAPVDFIRGHASHLHVIRQRDNAAGLIRTREERDPLSQGCVGNIRVGSRETRRDRERVESPKRTAEGERVVSNTEARPDDVLVAQTIGKADARSEVLLADRNVVIEIDVERVEIELLHGPVFTRDQRIDLVTQTQRESQVAGSLPPVAEIQGVLPLPRGHQVPLKTFARGVRQSQKE